MHIWEVKDKDGKGLVDGIKITHRAWSSHEFIYYDTINKAFYDDKDVIWCPPGFMFIEKGFKLWNTTYQKTPCPHCGWR